MSGVWDNSSGETLDDWRVNTSTRGAPNSGGAGRSNSNPSDDHDGIGSWIILSRMGTSVWEDSGGTESTDCGSKDTLVTCDGTEFIWPTGGIGKSHSDGVCIGCDKLPWVGGTGRSHSSMSSWGEHLRWRSRWSTGGDGSCHSSRSIGLPVMGDLSVVGSGAVGRSHSSITVSSWTFKEVFRSWMDVSERVMDWMGPPIVGFWAEKCERDGGDGKSKSELSLTCDGLGWNKSIDRNLFEWKLFNALTPLTHSHTFEIQNEIFMASQLQRLRHEWRLYLSMFVIFLQIRQIYYLHRQSGGSRNRILRRWNRQSGTGRSWWFVRGRWSGSGILRLSGGSRNRICRLGTRRSWWSVRGRWSGRSIPMTFMLFGRGIGGTSSVSRSRMYRMTKGLYDVNNIQYSLLILFHFIPGAVNNHFGCITGEQEAVDKHFSS